MPIKQIKKSLLYGFLLKGIGLIIFLYVKLCYATARWKIEGIENIPEKKTPVIFCFWHGRAMATFKLIKYVSRTNVIISRSKDGELMKTISSLFGLGSIRGSSNHKGKNRGGVAVFLEAAKILRKGENMAITPDGPVGPRMRVSGGVMDLAIISGALLIPTAVSAKPSIILNNWDRFMILLPFSKIALKVSPAIISQKNLRGEDKEQKRIELENSLNNITRELDKEMGIKEILPAEHKK